jgi:GT2 family glycosyltransferase
MEGIPHIAVFNGKNEGFVKATNTGLALSTAPYVVLLNNDVVFTPQWLPRLLQWAEKFPHVGIIGSLTSPSRSWQSISSLAERNLGTPKFEGFAPMPEYPGDEYAVEYADRIAMTYKGKYQDWCGMVAFFCTLIKREVFADIGFLSEDYGMGFADDDDFCLRARMAGWKCLLAWDTFVVHKHRATWKKYVPDWEEHIQKGWETFKKNKPKIERGD